MRQAAEVAHIHRSSPYALAARDPKFAAAWSAAEDDFVDLLELEANRRALGGSDRLLEFLLKSRRPTVYAASYSLRAELHAEALRVADKLGIPVAEVVEAASRRAEELGR